MRDNLRRSRTSPEIPRAKLAKDPKFGDQFLFFAPFACFARDIAGFGWGSTALGHSW
jgi:hypothetical protein